MIRHRNSCRSWHISRQKVWPDFWPFKVVQGQIWRCQSRSVGPTYKCSGRSDIVSVTVFEIFWVTNFDADLWPWRGLTPGPKFTKRETICYLGLPSCKISAWLHKWSEMCVTKLFHLLTLGELTPGPKFTKRGDDLLPTQVYHPTKFYRPASTHAGDICYQNSCGHWNTETVNDISPACLSECGDNKPTHSLIHTQILYWPYMVDHSTQTLLLWQLLCFQLYLQPGTAIVTITVRVSNSQLHTDLWLSTTLYISITARVLYAMSAFYFLATTTLTIRER